MDNGRSVRTSTRIWTDPDMRKVSREAFWFYRYLYENDHVHGITGVGQIPVDLMAFESRLTMEEIEKANLEELYLHYVEAYEAEGAEEIPAEAESSEQAAVETE